MPQTTNKGHGLIRIGQSYVRGSYLYDRAENGDGRCRIRLAANEGRALMAPAGQRESLRLPGGTVWQVTHRGVLDQGEFVWLDFEGIPTEERVALSMPRFMELRSDSGHRSASSRHVNAAGV